MCMCVRQADVAMSGSARGRYKTFAVCASKLSFLVIPQRLHGERSLIFGYPVPSGHFSNFSRNAEAFINHRFTSQKCEERTGMHEIMRVVPLPLTVVVA